MYTILLVVHTILVLFLIIMVLLQRTDSDGLGGLGGGGNQFMTGRATANLMTRTTAILAGLFMLTSIVLGVMANRVNNRSIIDEAPVTQEAPADTAKEKVEPQKTAPVKTEPSVPKAE